MSYAVTTITFLSKFQAIPMFWLIEHSYAIVELEHSYAIVELEHSYAIVEQKQKTISY